MNDPIQVARDSFLDVDPKVVSDAALLQRALQSGRPNWEEAALALEQGEMPLRYLRNGNALSIADQALLARVTVMVVGCGGLGGYVLEHLARAGVGHIKACDPDVFEESNANRQLLAATRTMGRSKALVAQERIAQVNPLVRVEAIPSSVSASLLEGVQVVADCLGGATHRLTLQQLAKEADVLLVAAGVSGWSALVSSTLPGDTGLGEFMSSTGQGSETVQGVLGPTVAFAAAVQAAEILRFLTRGIPALRGHLLMADLWNMRCSTMALTTSG